MKKLYYIKCSCPGDHWICDVTDNILEANKLLQEHKEDDSRSKFKIIYSPGENEAIRTWFNYKRVDKFLTTELGFINYIQNKHR
tara:strand:+ start:284 stop:535 length:252 start_codon:yes stop_codon:yes gene_type:complete